MPERIVTRLPLKFHREVPRSSGKRTANSVRIIHSQLEPKAPNNVISLDDFERYKFNKAFEAEFHEQFFEDEPQEVPGFGFLERVRENVLARYPQVQEAWKREDAKEARRQRHYTRRIIIRKDDWSL